MKTYNELYINTRNTLKRSGIEAYALEARVLVASAAGKSVQGLLRDLSLKRREGDTFLEFLLLFGAVQVLMESLRKDGHMTVNAFVRLEMILSMLLVGCGVIVLFIRNVKRRPALSWAALVSVFAAVGLGVLIEFKIDRSQISHYLLYAAFIAVLAVPVALGMLLRKEDGKSGQA